jgi:hypothetical protein
VEKQDKEKVYEKFRERSEKEVISRKGVKVLFGNDFVMVRPLPWDKSNDFEDQIAAVLKKFAGMIDVKSDDFESQVKTVLTLLREDLISLASAATEGLVSYDYIREKEASKNDVIDVVARAIEVNYGYLKNLIALSGQLMR